METGNEEDFDDATMQYIWLHAIGTDEYVDDVDEADEEFQEALSDALELVISCQRLVERTRSINQVMHLRQLNRVRDAIFRASSQNWGEFRANFSEDFMMSLRWAAQDMSTHWHEQTIQMDELISIHKSVEELSERIIASSLDPSLKAVLLDGLEAMRRAILDYRIAGADGIRQAVDSNIGAVVRHFQDIMEVPDDEDKDLVNEFLGLINAMNKKVTVALKLKELGEGAINLLSIAGAG